MPWSPDDSDRFKKNLGPAAKRKWAHVANSVLQQTGDEKSAIRAASGVTRAAKRRRLLNDQGLIKRKGLPG